MQEDHLDKEIAITAELTDHGITAKAKSRTLAAIDRLGGNLVEWLNVRIERDVSPHRSALERQQALERALTRKAEELLATDTPEAAMIVGALLTEASREQSNKQAVIQEALDDLEREPPSEEEAISGPDTLGEDFIGRFESYSAEASTEQLREKWGRVLAQEVRRPGVFSHKHLRTVDELDPKTAALFESLCKNRLSGIVPTPLTGAIPFPDTEALVSAGLIVDPGLTGRVTPSFAVSLPNYGDSWLFNFLPHVIIIQKDGYVAPNDHKLLTGHDGNPAIPCIGLTAVGADIASILPNTQRQAAMALVAKLSGQIGTAKIEACIVGPQGQLLPI